MKELSFFNKPGFILLCFLEYFVPQIYMNLMHTPGVANYYLTRGFADDKILPSLLDNSVHNHRLSYNVVSLSIIGYIDRFFFYNFLYFEAYDYMTAFAFYKVLLRRWAFWLLRIDHLYYNSSFFMYNKLSLDLLLWDVFNFNALHFCSYLLDDIILYLEKVDIDNNICLIIII